MKTRSEVNEEKIRGGFYTPERLVHACIQRVQQLARGQRELRLLEPGAGDGAFLKALASSSFAVQLDEVVAIEVLEGESAKCRLVLEGAPFTNRVETASFIRWSCENSGLFD